MQKLAKILTLVFTGFFTLTTTAFAAGIQNPVGFNSVEDILNTYLPLLRIIIVMMFVGVMMYGGFVWLSAGSSEEKVANAKKIIIAGITGFILIVLAPAIVQFMGALLGVDGGLLTSF